MNWGHHVYDNVLAVKTAREEDPGLETEVLELPDFNLRQMEMERHKVSDDDDNGPEFVRGISWDVLSRVMGGLTSMSQDPRNSLSGSNLSPVSLGLSKFVMGSSSQLLRDVMDNHVIQVCYMLL